MSDTHFSFFGFSTILDFFFLRIQIFRNRILIDLLDYLGDDFIQNKTKHNYRKAVASFGEKLCGEVLPLLQGSEKGMSCLFKQSFLPGVILLQSVQARIG